MPDRMTAAMEEAYASTPANVTILHTIELDHESFPEPIRVVTGDEGDIETELVELTTETGATVAFRAMAFDITPPGFDEDGPTQGQLRIDGVSDLLTPFLEQASVAPGTIHVTYRAYRSDARFEPGDVITGLKLRQVDVSPTIAEGAIGFDEVGTQAFPRAVYAIEHYPGIFQA